MLKHQHKTLAKTLDYIARRSPGEYGLFWDRGGVMPWKEFYWVLQEDPSLRFVRESTIRELILLGIDLPFMLDGNLLRLLPSVSLPEYPPSAHPPERLFYGVRPKMLVNVQNIGLRGSSRPFLPLSADRDLAIRMAKRREQEPIIVEILAKEATAGGVSFLVGGSSLFLAESVPVQFILFPKIRHDLAARLTERVMKPKAKPSPPATPGSFTLSPHHVEPHGSGKSAAKAERGSKSGWKKASRKERRKRDI